MKGKNTDENLVFLTLREHFVCHKLLVEIYPNNHQLVYAITMMANTKIKKEYYKVSSRDYERYRALFLDAYSGENHPNFGKTASKETRKRQSIAQKGKSHKSYVYNKPKATQETKDKISIAKKGKSMSKKAIRNMVKAQRKRFAILKKLKLEEEKRKTDEYNEMRKQIICKYCGKPFHFDCCKF